MWDLTTGEDGWTYVPRTPRTGTAGAGPGQGYQGTSGEVNRARPLLPLSVLSEGIAPIRLADIPRVGADRSGEAGPPQSRPCRSAWMTACGREVAWSFCRNVAT